MARIGNTRHGCRCGAGFEPGIVLDPFMGSGTTALVARELGRRWIGVEISAAYCRQARERIRARRRTPRSTEVS